MKLRDRPFILLQCLTLSGFISSCSPAIPLATPPEGYKRPIAERPMLQKGDLLGLSARQFNKDKDDCVSQECGVSALDWENLELRKSRGPCWTISNHKDPSHTDAH